MGFWLVEVGWISGLSILPANEEVEERRKSGLSMVRGEEKCSWGEEEQLKVRCIVTMYGENKNKLVRRNAQK